MTTGLLRRPIGVVAPDGPLNLVRSPADEHMVEERRKASHGR